jgi:hypothetical protein
LWVRVSILPLSTILIFDFGIISTAFFTVFDFILEQICVRFVLFLLFYIK